MPKTRENRTKRLHLLLSNAEWDMVLELCDELGLTASDLVRQLVRRRYEKMRQSKAPAR